MRGGKRENAGRKKGQIDKKRKVFQDLITDAIAKKCIDNIFLLAKLI